MPKTAKEIEKILLDNGWVLYAQSGSHRQYIHPNKPGKITVPFHGNKDIKIGTEKAILKAAGIKR